MADPDLHDEPAREPDRDSPPGAPRWVKVLGILAVVVVVLVGVMLLTGGAGEHGPGRHSGGGDTPSEGTGGQTPPAERHTPPGAEGHQPPPGGHAPPDAQDGTP